LDHRTLPLEPSVRVGDDYADGRERLLNLSFLDFHVMEARGVDEALELARTLQPDVILIELRRGHRFANLICGGTNWMYATRTKQCGRLRPSCSPASSSRVIRRRRATRRWCGARGQRGHSVRRREEQVRQRGLNVERVSECEPPQIESFQLLRQGPNDLDAHGDRSTSQYSGGTNSSQSHSPKDSAATS
jgi:hypothetical protein